MYFGTSFTIRVCFVHYLNLMIRWRTIKGLQRNYGGKGFRCLWSKIKRTQCTVLNLNRSLQSVFSLLHSCALSYDNYPVFKPTFSSIWVFQLTNSPVVFKPTDPQRYLSVLSQHSLILCLQFSILKPYSFILGINILNLHLIMITSNRSTILIPTPQGFIFISSLWIKYTLE